MALYCEGKDCNLKDNCLRYTELKRIRVKAKGDENGVWLTNKKECYSNLDYFYVKICEL